MRKTRPCGRIQPAIDLAMRKCPVSSVQATNTHALGRHDESQHHATATSTGICMVTSIKLSGERPILLPPVCAPNGAGSRGTAAIVVCDTLP